MSITSYRIADPAPQLDAGLLARFARVEAATVGHYLHDRFMRNDLRPLIDGVRVAGTAQTVSIPGPDSTLLYHAMDRVRPGDILVIDRAGDERHAAWGGFMAAVAKERGLAAVIIDRRYGERRRTAIDHPADRRRADRRRHSIAPSLRDDGWAVVTMEESTPAA